MDGLEILLVFIVGTVLLAGPLVALILAFIALHRTRQIKRLAQRIAELEARVGTTYSPPAPTPSMPPVSEQDVISAEVVSEPAANVARRSAAVDSAAERRTTLSIQPSWETFIGQKAFGWLAVVLFVFGAAFFLRYAYQNNWIGPVGRVAIGEIVGAALMIAGWRYHQHGWRRFSLMLSATGIVVLYLATYSAFGFYHLLAQQHAGAFLVVLIVESMIAAVLYRSAVLALVAVLGGLLTPVLMHTDHDNYSALFTYLAALNLGVVVALWMRHWTAVGTVAHLGTQALFWTWYQDNYHPEKFAWTLGFLGVLFALYLGHTIVAVMISRRNAGREELARFMLNAILGFAGFYLLIRDDYRPWLGSAAITMATLYALVGRVTLSWRPTDQRLLLTSLATAVGFVAWSFPIQADVRWVSLGWAAMSAALWWFGLRVSAQLLRVMSAVLGALSVGRLLVFDLPIYTRDPFIPIFNGVALPSLGVAACILIAVFVTERYVERLRAGERFLVATAGVVGVLLVWLVLSFECYGYFDSQSIGSTEVQLWRWRGQLALTVFWTVFASVLLALGFQLQRERLRWLSMALYGVTVVKLFLVDMANVQQIYRILAFFVLAVVLGVVARVYQRFR